MNANEEILRYQVVFLTYINVHLSFQVIGLVF